MIVTGGVVGGAHARDAGEARHVAGVERLVELAADAHQLLQVLDAAPRLDRALGLELGEVAGLLEDRLDRRPDALGRLASNPTMSSSRSRMPAERLAGDAGHGGAATAPRGT